jgi:hypothetical protein
MDIWCDSIKLGEEWLNEQANSREMGAISPFPEVFIMSGTHWRARQGEARICLQPYFMSVSRWTDQLGGKYSG